MLLTLGPSENELEAAVTPSQHLEPVACPLAACGQHQGECIPGTHLPRLCPECLASTHHMICFPACS